MPDTRLLRVLGLLLLVDGTLGLVLGRAYAYRWVVGHATSPYYRAVSWVAGRADWLVRLFGVAEAVLGLAVLARAPVGVRELYGVVARFYDPVSFVWRNWLYPDLHRAFDRALATYLPQGGRVLDLGCGTGANLERLLALGLPFGSYTGVDLSEDMLTRAREKFAQVTNVQFQQLDLLADPLPEGPFDLVVSTWVFSHLPEPERVVEKAWGRLRHGGQMVLLFLTETGTWLDALIKPIARIFSARPLPEDVYRRFPGLVSRDRFGSRITALVVLQKPDVSSAR